MLQVRAAAYAQFLVRDIDSPVLDVAQLHHLVNVLRATNTHRVSLTDGQGSWRLGCFSKGSWSDLSPVEFEPAPRARVAVGFSLGKLDKPELVVQKLTEIGVDLIVPLLTERTVVRLNADRSAKRLAKLRGVAENAAMQSRRVWVPEVGGIATLASLDEDHRVLAQPGGEPVTGREPIIIVGPEGGWSDDELATASRRVDLGPNILRTETAAIVAGVQLVAARRQVEPLREGARNGQSGRRGKENQN